MAADSEGVAHLMHCRYRICPRAANRAFIIDGKLNRGELQDVLEVGGGANTNDSPAEAALHNKFNRNLCRGLHIGEFELNVSVGEIDPAT